MEPDTHQQGPPFLQLPIELLLQIWDYLSVDDVLALRLVCHRIETLLFDSFCYEFFAERRFSITFHSLKVLVDITRNTRLKDSLTHLTIGLDRLHSSDALQRFTDYWDPINHTVRDTSPVKTGVDPYKLEAFALEQNFLVSSGQFQLMLSEALGNLSHLEELSLRDRNVIRRTIRFGKPPLLVSYGTSHILRETGIDFTGAESHLNNYDDRFVDMVFSAMLLALARGQTRINALTVDIRQGNIGLSSSAFSLPIFFHKDVQPTLFHLRSLDLSVSFVQVMLGSYSSRSDSFLKWQRHQLFTFLQQTPNLVILRVQSKDQGFFADGIIGWLAISLDPTGPEELCESNGLEDSGSYTGGRLPGDPSAMVLPHSKHRFQALEELELGNMRAQTHTIYKILQALSGSLRRLTFCKMALCVSKDDNELDSNPRKPDAWSALFQGMHSLLRLEQLTLSALEHHTPSCSQQNNGHPVAFLPSNFGVQSGPANGLLHAWSHQGTADAIRDFLEEVYSKTIIICRKCKRRNAAYRSVDEILEL
ncbi:hypothetical protein F5Y19DRAFT_461693 [Xylariaceae sp. FL1651]|nr:hypothetical protein F5Y19DRAFT_461693 [Xylariaceae sp. FL1651]